MTQTASPYGTHRVIEPLGVLPQGAWKIDNQMSIADNEILIDVSALNVDAASFTQIKAEAGDDAQRVGEIVCGIVAQRGKLHNPVTGSGGMLIGTVRAVGSALAGKVPGYSILRLEHLAPAVAVSVLGGDAPAAASLPRQHFPRG